VDGALGLGSAAGGAPGSGTAVAISEIAKAAIAETNSSVALASGRVILGERIRHFTGYTTLTIG
jgi:hypothetical protein